MYLFIYLQTLLLCYGQQIVSQYIIYFLSWQNKFSSLASVTEVGRHAILLNGKRCVTSQCVTISTKVTNQRLLNKNSIVARENDISENYVRLTFSSRYYSYDITQWLKIQNSSHKQNSLFLRERTTTSFPVLFPWNLEGKSPENKVIE